MSVRGRALTALAVALLAAGCGGRGPERFPGANLVLVGIDTLRADHLGCYGYRRPTSPRLDALAREGVRFETVVAQSPWTLPAFASIFTGLLPSSHRAGEGAFANVSRLDPARETVATVLRRAGYRTGSFVSNGYVGADVGMAQGFDDHRQGMLAAGAVQGALAWLDAHARERFFLFLHIVDPHQPYAPSPEDAAPFVDPAYAGPVGTSYSGFGDPAWSAADRQRVIDLYDGEVHYADRLLGQVLDALGRLAVADTTLVVVTADHGEELFERGTLGHGHTLHEELLRVPLVMRFPGRRPRGLVRRQVRAMDILPTVLDALGVPAPAPLDAVSLIPLVRGGTSGGETDTALAEYLRVTPERKAVRQGGMKLIFTPTTAETRLYDLAADPGELTDVAAAEPARAAALRARIEQRLLATLEGFHLLVRGGRAAHRVRAEVRGDGRLAEVSLYNPEGEDRLELADDGRTLVADLALAARAHRPAFGMDVDDDDGLRFRVPDGAAVEVRLLEDGAPLAAARLHLGVSGAAPEDSMPWRFAPRDPRLLAAYPVVPPAAAGDAPSLALLYVHRPSPPAATLDPRTRENLRALGYLE